MPIKAGEFMLIDRKVVNLLVEMRENIPYLRGVIPQVGVNSSSVNYRWNSIVFLRAN